MRKLFLIISLISILALTGCSVFTGRSSATPKPKILRQTELAGKWRMYQIEVTLTSGTELPLIIQLADGDKADGYFYVEKGDNNIAFQIAGISQIYQSDFKNIPTGQPASDRFSFTATQAQGLSYELTLSNNTASSQKSSTTVFLEVICPGNGPIFTPLEVK
jgi:hypothetical protein